MSRISVPLDIFDILVTRWNLESLTQDQYYKVEKYLEDNRLT